MSKKIKDLYIDGMYENIINQKIDYEDGEDILYYILSLEAIHKYEEALGTYYKYREIVENWDLISSSKALLYLLVYFKKFKLINDEIEYFRGLPYINQETEEYLNSMNEYVDQVVEYFNQSEPNKEANISMIKSMLYSSSKEEKLGAIKLLLDLDAQGVKSYDIVLDYLNSTAEFDMVYSILLEYAMYGGVTKRITFKKNGNYYSLIPSEYTTYVKTMESYISDELKYMGRTMKNISVYNYISILFRPSFLYTLPEKLDKNDLYCLLSVIVEECCKIFGVDPTQDNYFSELKFKPENLEKYRAIVKTVENEF